MEGFGLAAVSVKVTGGDKYKAFLEKMAKIAGGVKAGIFGDATTTTENGKFMRIAEYAVYNEYGTSRIPPRPFMRTVAKERPKTWVGIMVGHVRGQAANVQAWKDALGLAGEQMREDIRNSIMNGNWTPNAPSTVAAKARKGKVQPDKPLFDTGQMYAAVTYQVVDKI